MHSDIARTIMLPTLAWESFYPCATSPCLGAHEECTKIALWQSLNALQARLLPMNLLTPYEKRELCLGIVHCARSTANPSPDHH